MFAPIIYAIAIYYISYRISELILTLYQCVQGYIQDGTKIIIFSARVEQEGKTDILHLSYNSIRKASNSAKLGYVNPRYLGRPLSVNSLSSSKLHHAFY